MHDRPLVRIRSAGAAQGLIAQLQPGFEARHSLRFACNYANVGATFEQVARDLRSGTEESCALTVLTPPFLARLQDEFPGRVQPAGSLGQAATGFVSADQDQTYSISSTAALRRTLADLDVLLAPDMQNSTGGRQLLRVLDTLGLSASLAPRTREFAGGAEAVHALSGYKGRRVRVLACAQHTEVALAQGVRFVGGFPGEFALSTEYVVALIDAPGAKAVHAFAKAMTAVESLSLRQACGFTEISCDGG